ncbi:MAG: hypothetical protein OHK0046_17990 [Anaerolineae bacterium]
MSSLFTLGQAHFQSIVSLLKAEGITISPQLTLCAGDGLLCYYDTATQSIHLSLPDRATHQGRLQMLLLRSLLDCESDAELVEFLQHIMRWLVAHEIAHHCRHQMGFLSQNIWQEEQIAHYLSIAVSKADFSAEARQWCNAFLQRAVHNLAGKQAAGSSAIDSYHSLSHSLYASGLIDAATLAQFTQIGQWTGCSPEVIAQHGMVANLPPDITQRVRNRHQTIRRINAGGHHQVFQHLYYYFGWMHIGLMSVEHYSIHTFRTHFLNDTSTYLDYIEE